VIVLNDIYGCAGSHVIAMSGSLRGNLVLRGQADIDLSKELPGLIIPLNGMTSRYPVFDADEHQSSSSYRVERTYCLAKDREITEAPVWITPAIAPAPIAARSSCTSNGSIWVRQMRVLKWKTLSRWN